MNHIAAALTCALSLSLVGCSRPAPDTGTAGDLLYVWASDIEIADGDVDFLATIDADASSTTYGDVLHTTTVGAAGLGAHHAEPVAPATGPLFANGFTANRTFLFDLSSPAAPLLARELEAVPGLTYPHDFRRLADGTVLVTMQRGDGSRPGDPGGLALLSSDGRVIRTSSAEDSRFPGALLRPYSPEVIPEIDRVLTTGRSMFFRTERVADVIQIWRLSDLALLKTIAVPRVPPAREPECVLGGDEMCPPGQYAGEAQPFEIRMLEDGSALLNTFMCAFYRIDGIAGDEPTITPVFNLAEEIGCSVPVRRGRWAVMPIIFSRAIVTLDVSDPSAPREVHRYQGPDRFMPHWAAADPGSDRIVVTTAGPGTAPTVAMFHLDLSTGALRLDDRFGSLDDGVPGVSFDRARWPHGATGAAMPHAALFGLRAR